MAPTVLAKTRKATYNNKKIVLPKKNPDVFDAFALLIGLFLSKLMKL